MCFLTPSQDVYCQGDSQFGQLGGALWAMHPVKVSGTQKYTDVTAGIFHACGLAANGAAYCWGYNGWGAAGGNASTLRVERPTRVGMSTFLQLSAAVNHTCGIDSSGAAHCWGAQYGAPGGTAPFPLIRYAPTAVAGGHAFAQISAGSAHTCGITPAGRALCWGMNGVGQLGNGTLTSSASPVLVQGGLTFVAISAGPSNTCGVTTDGSAYCWGEEGEGSGYAPLLPASTVPRRVQLPDGVQLTSINVGNGSTCGVSRDYEVYCWGFVWDSDAVETGAPPTKVPGNLSFVSVSSNGGRSCGVTREPAVYCWSLVVGPPYIGSVGKLEGQP